MCGTCGAFKPLANYKMGTCLRNNKHKIFDQTCDDWVKTIKKQPKRLLI